jgi:hypothetical protein
MIVFFFVEIFLFGYSPDRGVLCLGKSCRVRYNYGVGILKNTVELGL